MSFSFIFNNEDFPPVQQSTAEGLLAIGGDLGIPRLIKAYSLGIFPWFSEDDPIMWWSPDPRMILKPADFKTSKSLKKIVRDSQYEIKIDTAFEEVISACGSMPRQGQEGTWITNDLKTAFILLHKIGLAHSFEIFMDNELVGGLYGLSLGKVFFGESMFYKVNNASKLAFYHFVNFLKEHDFALIDAQQETNHLKSLGAYAIERSHFIELLAHYLAEPTLQGNWGNGTAKLLKLSFDNIRN